MKPGARQWAEKPEAAGSDGPPGRQISAGTDISGIASAGDHALNVQYLAEQMTALPSEAFGPVSDLVVPDGLANLPVRPGLFVGRAAELKRLDAAMAGTGGALVQAMHGLGGIGKSTLAAQWAAARTSDHLLTWWITSDTRESVDAGLAELGAALRPTLSGSLPIEALRELALQWLSANPGWLLILDNVTDPADIGPLLRRTPGGRYLITSRRATGWHNIADAVRIDVLSLDEATELLTSILVGAGQRDLDGAAQLCEALGCLPLAVEQTGAYMAQTGTTPRGYLDLLANYPAEMYQAAAENSDENRTIARIWRVTLDRLASEPLAGEILRILAWYAPESIPRALLDGLAAPPEVVSAIGRLAAYSMITADAAVLSIHRLVQAVARTPESGDSHRSADAITRAREQAVARLRAVLPDWRDPAAWPAWRTLLPHVDALAEHAPPETDSHATAGILHRAGCFRQNQGQVAAATVQLRRALAACERVLSPDHPDILASRSNLAGACLEAGDLGQAVPLFELVLADCERVLGSDHPHTLTSGNSLAFAYQAAGDLSAAILLSKRALAGCERVLGPDHPVTLTSRNNLAGAYLETGDLGRAVPLFESVLADRGRVLGRDHPKTLMTRNNLASAYQTTGDLERAIPLSKQVLADRERVLGPDHPDTLKSRNNLAGVYLESGDLVQAVSLFERALADSKRVLGRDHPDTLTSWNNLAYAYRKAGDLELAMSLCKQVHTHTERVLGPDHLDALGSRSNLAGAYLDAGDLGRAIPLFEQVVADCERILGPDHPRTLISRSDLADAYLCAGDLWPQT